MQPFLQKILFSLILITYGLFPEASSSDPDAHHINSSPTIPLLYVKQQTLSPTSRTIQHLFNDDDTQFDFNVALQSNDGNADVSTSSTSKVDKVTTTEGGGEQNIGSTETNNEISTKNDGSPTTFTTLPPPSTKVESSTGKSELTSSVSTQTQRSETTMEKGSSNDKVETSSGGSIVVVTSPMPSTLTTDEQHRHTMPVPEHLQNKNRTGNVALRGNCSNTEQCSGEHTDCRLGICKCELGYLPRPDNGDLCGDAKMQQMHPPQADPTMIGVVIGLVLMSFTLCVVMRLFAKARFQENRTIFNTPNPRLMNVKILGSKALIRGNSGGQRSRRGSQASINSETGGSGGGGTEGGGHHHGHPPLSIANPKEKPKRARPHRQASTDDKAAGSSSSRPTSGMNSKSNKSRQESNASNSNV